ncbi:MAG: LuxR C-terminal-related transcriptional regulator [Spirochaetia bacterium]
MIKIDKNRKFQCPPIILMSLLAGILLAFAAGCTSTEIPEERRYEREPDYRFDYRIAPWFAFKTAACSVTFDDGTLDQYVVAFPELNNRDIKATFFLVTGHREAGVWQDGARERLLFSWKQAREIAASGHEIASHGTTHADLTQQPQDAHEELRKSRDTILSHIPTLSRGMSFSWPYWRSTDELQEIARSYYIGARSGGGNLDHYPLRFDGIPRKTPRNLFQINSMRISEQFYFRDMKNFCDKVIENGRWLVLDLHGIDNGDIPRKALGWDPISLQSFETLLDYIQEKDFWIAPFGAVLQYIRVRDNASVTLNKRTKNTLGFTVEDGLDNDVYSRPLSMEIFVPENWNAVEVYRNGIYTFRTRVEKNRVRINIVPDGSAIVFVKAAYAGEYRREKVLNLPGLNGLQATRELKDRCQDVKVIMLTAYDDKEQIYHAIRAGASAYHAKDVSPERLIGVIRRVYEGQYVVDETVLDERGIADWLLRKFKRFGGGVFSADEEFLSPLTPREMEILELVVQGMSNRKIAYQLGISHQTVKNHMTAILRKLGATGRTEAAVSALRRGWVPLRDGRSEPGSEEVGSEV